MKQKLLFFDIDGTLWDRHNFIPESTVEAIYQARKNGHLTFINSGRTRAYITDPDLLGLGFDGIVSGCGTMIELNNKVLYYYEMQKEQVSHTINILRKYKMLPILEGRNHLYMDYEDFCRDNYGQKLLKEMGDRLRPVTDPEKSWEISKLSLLTTDYDLSVCDELLGDEFDILKHTPTIAELVPKGFSKGAGIRKVCELIGADIRDTYAFGDSINDADMLKTAGTSIVMGNANEDIKLIGDLVTDNLEDNGIYNACKKLQLI